MTLTTFQKLLTELLMKYNEEAENHNIYYIELTPTVVVGNYKRAEVIGYTIEVKTNGK